ncbi:MAG: helix-turn-helix transcriptional regulator, partial [Clostridiales bacterium]|nr:helix-turn-helix transcriptional regulator [Clostridiales bacterium]
LYLFIASLVEAGGAGELYADSVTKADSYLNKAIEYINMNYSRQISVADVANHVGLNRSYIGSLFKNRLGTSIQEYLINLRIGKASLLLKDPKLSIGDISRSVGYDDPLHFSKAFRKTRQMSPRDYRKSMF